MEGTIDKEGKHWLLTFKLLSQILALLILDDLDVVCDNVVHWVVSDRRLPTTDVNWTSSMVGLPPGS